MGVFTEQNVGKEAKAIQHKGVEILVTDFSGLKGQDHLQAMKENTKAIVPKIIGRRDCVMVILFQNCLLNQDAIDYVIKLRKAMDGTFVATAIVGLSAIQKAGLQISNTLQKTNVATEFFDNEREAVDWVVERHNKSRVS